MDIQKVPHTAASQAQTVGGQVDSWIAEEQLPANPALKVIRTTDPDFGLSQDEIDERNEFIHWYLSQDFLPLLSIPKPQHESDFFIMECSAESPEYTAFNSHDFQDTLKPFDRYGYAIKKVLERVKDLAIMHSCISSPEGRGQTHQRYLSLIDSEFRNRLLSYVEQRQKATTDERRFSLKGRIAEMNRRILECNKIWERYAPWDS